MTWYAIIALSLPLEVGLTQILAYHETLFIVDHVRIHLDFSSIIISLGL